MHVNTRYMNSTRGTSSNWQEIFPHENWAHYRLDMSCQTQWGLITGQHWHQLTWVVVMPTVVEGCSVVGCCTSCCCPLTVRSRMGPWARGWPGVAGMLLLEVGMRCTRIWPCEPPRLIRLKLGWGWATPLLLAAHTDTHARWEHDWQDFSRLRWSPLQSLPEQTPSGYVLDHSHILWQPGVQLVRAGRCRPKELTHQCCWTENQHSSNATDGTPLTHRSWAVSCRFPAFTIPPHLGACHQTDHNRAEASSV